MNTKSNLRYNVTNGTFIPEYSKKMTLTQLQSIVRLATVNAQIENKTFPFAVYEELFNFNRKEAINFLMQIDYEFFDEIDKDKVINTIGKYYYDRKL